MEGWIKLHRKFLEWEWYTDTNTKILFLHLLLKACYSDTKYKGKIIERGAFYTKLDDLAEETKLSKQTIRTSLKKLQETGEIIKKSTHKETYVRLVNYNVYQCNDEGYQHTGNTQSTHNQHTSNTQSTHNQHTSNTPIEKEYKNINNIKNKKNKNTRKESISARVTSPEKINFAEFVTMTNDEYKSLIERTGSEEVAKRCIEILDNYKGSSGKEYKSDYRTILNWVINKYNEENKINNKAQQSNGFFEYAKELTKNEEVF